MARYQIYTGVDKDGRRCTYCISRFAGKAVRGVAKCSTDDTYDEVYGAKLATARCDVAVAEKRLKRAQKLKAEAMANVAAANERLSKMLAYETDAGRELRDYIRQLEWIEAESK